MPAFISRIPFRESRGLGVVCLVMLAAMMAVLANWPRPVKEEKAIARKQAEVAAARARGVNPPTGAYPRVEHYVAVWLRKGWVANTILVGGVLLLSPWLGRRRPQGVSMVAPPGVKPLAGWERVAVILLVGAAAWHNAPRLSQSMWGDEEFNASRFILDEVSRDANGDIAIEPRSWTTTLWSIRKPTNHLGYSVFARLTHEAFFEKGTGPADPWFSEALLRAPVFAAGLLLIPAFIWALRVWGVAPWCGLFLLVLHPWFTRFGVDGRGYGLIMLGGVVMLGLLGRGLQTGLWRWWVGFGVAGFLVLWSNLQGVYPVAALNLVALACLVRRGLDPRARGLLAARWIVAGWVTAMLTVGWLAPCWPQLREFMARGEIHGDLDWRFWKDGLCAWWLGMPFHSWDLPANPLRVALELSMAALPWLHVLGIVLLAVFLGAGAVALWRDRSLRPLLIFSIGAPVLMLFHMQVTNNRPYDWYFSPFVAGLFLLASAAAGRWVAGGRRKPLAVALVALMIGLYGFATREPRARLRAHPIEASRESVALYRKVTNPRHPDIDKEVMSGGFVFFTEGYDPALRRFRDAAELRALMAEADRRGKAFFVNVGHIAHARTELPEICRLLDDPAVFEHVRTFHGLQHMTTREVYRYRGRGAGAE